MINGTITEFIDQLYYGQEIVFLYHERKYFIQGWWSEDKQATTMVLEDVTDGASEGYLWECHADNMRKCADASLCAPIWAGKDFLQIETDVTWSDW